MSLLCTSPCTSTACTQWPRKVSVCSPYRFISILYQELQLLIIPTYMCRAQHSSTASRGCVTTCPTLLLFVPHCQEQWHRCVPRSSGQLCWPKPPLPHVEKNLFHRSRVLLHSLSWKAESRTTGFYSYCKSEQLWVY